MEKPKLLGISGCHPSHFKILTNLLGQAEDAGVKDVKIPVCWCSAGDDPDAVKPNGVEQKILDQKPFGKQCVFKTYPDVKHGWMTRADLKEEANLNAYKDGLSTLSKFYSDCLKK